jgi:2-aminoadipate transaminase
MNYNFSDRISGVPRSFIREILKVAADPSFISFAGGLPNKDFFPLKEIEEAAAKVLKNDGKTALQYSITEGYLPLRKYIANRYKIKKGISVSPEHILITSGSQQGLDLMGKIFINEGDNVLLEEPGYLGAIQAFSIFKAKFIAVPLVEEGMDIELMRNALLKARFKLFYAVPNFQNPSGISYSEENRHEVARLISNAGTVMIEDDPYGELRFLGTEKTSFKKMLPNQVIMLGTFSKIVAPAFRIGWIVAPDEVFEKLVIAKQAADLHTNYIGQRIIYQYLIDNDIDAHISKITEAYGKQRETMVKAIGTYFPDDINITLPEGGMFLWMTLPQGVSSITLFNKCIEKKVAFVPGSPFYTNKGDVNTLRLNFSCSDEKTIEEGIKRIAEALKSK